MTITVHNITIDGSHVPSGAPSWDVEHYEQVVRRILIHVFNSPVGMAIIPQLRRQLTIVPDGTFAPRSGGAAARPLDSRGATLRGGPRYVCGLPRDPGDLPQGTLLPDEPPGTGVGSDVTIFFTPRDWYDPTHRIDGFIRIMPTRWAARPNAYADEVLCHELVHATRQMRGVFQCFSVDYGYGSFEEFCAVEVTNVYASYRHRPIANQYAGLESRDRLLDPFGSQTRRERDESAWIERMRCEQPGFCYALSGIPVEAAPYNPFRRWRSQHTHYVLGR